LKMIALALGAVAATSSALATPTLVIWDNNQSVTVPAGANGIASYVNTRL